MTEKEKIILRHTELAKEFSKLNSCTDLLTLEEWKKIEDRKKEIMAEIHALREIEQSWKESNEVIPQSEIDLQMYNYDQVCEFLKISREHLTTLREIGIIKAIKTGKRYMFTKESILEFQRTYAGLDVSNRQKAIKSYEIVCKRLENKNIS